MIRAGLIACLLASPALADICAVPVEDGRATDGIEAEQPYRLAPSAFSVPGYPFLIIYPSNRGGLYTIDDGRYAPLEADFPRAGLWQFGSIRALADGRVIGAGARPKVLYQLNTDTGVFDPIRETEGYWRAAYDAATATYRFTMPDGSLFDLTADGPRPSALPVSAHLADVDSTMPRYIPGMSAYLSAGNDALWVLPDGADNWTRINVPRDLHNQLYQLQSAPIAVDPEQQIAQIKLGQFFVVLDIAKAVPKRLYTVSDVGAASVAQGRFIYEQRRNARRFNSKRSAWPDLLVLTRDGPDTVPGSPEIVPSGSNIAPFHIKSVGDRVLVWLNDGWWVYDGRNLLPAPTHFDLPKSVWRVTPGNDSLWENGRQVWRLDETLRSTPVALPSDGAQMKIELSDSFGGHVLISGGDGWFSPDLATFEPIRLPADVDLHSVVADLPAEKAILAIGADGLYLLADCD